MLFRVLDQCCSNIIYVGPALSQQWASISSKNDKLNAGPTLKRHWVNVSCLLGIDSGHLTSRNIIGWEVALLSWGELSHPPVGCVFIQHGYWHAFLKWQFIRALWMVIVDSNNLQNRLQLTIAISQTTKQSSVGAQIQNFSASFVLFKDIRYKLHSFFYIFFYQIAYQLSYRLQIKRDINQQDLIIADLKSVKSVTSE